MVQENCQKKFEVILLRPPLLLNLHLLVPVTSFTTSGSQVSQSQCSWHCSCVESILSYEADTWNMKKELQHRLDGTYTSSGEGTDHLKAQVKYQRIDFTEIFHQSLPFLLNVE